MDRSSSSAATLYSDIRGVIFDKDGTLFGYDATWAGWCDRVLEDLSKGDLALMREMAHAGGYDMVARTFRSGSPLVAGAIDEVISLWQSKAPHLSSDHINQVSLRHLGDLPNEPVCDFADVLGRLTGSGRRLGVATNDYEANAFAQLKVAGAVDLFDFVAGYDSGHGVKPGPGMIDAFCRSQDLPASAVAMVGDSNHDLDAGHAAGVGLIVAVLTGPATRSDLAPLADIVLSDISELPDVFGA